MKLDDRTIRLIAVGASISANCQPCLDINVSKALENGANNQEIAEAIQVGKMVRKGAASKMDNFISTTYCVAISSEKAIKSECGCGS